MPNYRRAWVGGGTFFFTVVTHRRRPLLTHPAALPALGAVVRATRRDQPFTIDAWVVLPDHMHTVWTLPEGDADFAGRWNLIKAGFSRRTARLFHRPELVSAGMRRQRRTAIWQRGYWEHLIRDEADLVAHVEYCHFNPVRHGLVAEARDWPHSTFHRYVRDGLYPESWGRGMSFADSVGRE